MGFEDETTSGPVTPRPERVHDDNYVLNELKGAFLDTTDAFGQQVSKGTRNVTDLPAFYDFSEERYRFIENGTRVQDPDADSTRFADQDEQFLLEPAAGDTLQFKTAESGRYVVGSDAALSWAFKFVSPLVDETDVFKLFLEDVFEVEYDGAGNGTVRSIKDGSTQTSRSFSPPTNLDQPSRPELTFNWYGVGRLELEIDYTDADSQKRSDPVTVTVDDDWLSNDPTASMGFELDVTNSGIQLEAGSMAYIEQTDTPPTSRPKPHIFSSGELNEIAATGYTPIAALRLDPNRQNVYTTLSKLNVTSEASVDVELWAMAVDAANTDADFGDPAGDGTNRGPAYPRNNSPQNSVLQWTPNVSTFPTRTYAVDGSTIPRGRNVGAAFEGSAGKGSSTTKVNNPFAEKRPIYTDDIILLMGHTPDASTATNVDVFAVTEQDW